jgi:hypothetical protein
MLANTSTSERVLFHMPTYNKLVRDRIPHLIMSQGKECRTRILDPEEYKQELRSKLREEIHRAICMERKGSWRSREFLS